MMKQNLTDLIKNITVGLVILFGMFILGSLAVRLDGAVALSIVSTMEQVVLGAMTLLGLMKGMDGAVNYANNRSQAQIAIAQAQAHAQVASAAVQAGIATPIPVPMDAPSNPLIQPTPAPVSAVSATPPVVGL